MSDHAKIEKVKTVLIVDDEKGLRDIISYYFADDGYDVKEAENVDDAIQKLGEGRVDLIISDVCMRGKTGIELLAYIRKNHFIEPVTVLLTAYTNISYEEVFNLGVDSILLKPFPVASILKVANRLLLPLTERWQICPITPPKFTLSCEGISILEYSADKTEFFRVGRQGFFMSSPGMPLVVGDDIGFRINTNDSKISLSGRGVIVFLGAGFNGVKAVWIEINYLEEPGRSQYIELVTKSLYQIQPKKST